MIRLDIKREPYWLDLPFGVRVKVRPARTSVNAAARARARRKVQALADQQVEIAAAGGEIAGLPDLADQDERHGLAEELYVQALGVSAVLDWVGVLDPDSDEPAPVNETTVGDLMSIPDIGDAFLAKYLAPVHAVESEGNGFGPAPNGTSAAGPNTAKAAGKPARAAPRAKRSKRKTARGAAGTTSTSRKP